MDLFLSRRLRIKKLWNKTKGKLKHAKRDGEVEDDENSLESEFIRVSVG